jgi:hypothetical protein
MFRLALIAILAIANLPAHSHESATAEEPPSPQSLEEDATVGSDSTKPAPVNPRGDILTLKSGQVIEGLQILRQNSANYILEVIDGITLDIPRRQVVSVDYDDFDPKLHNRKSTMIRGQRMSDILESKLDTDLSDPPFNYRNADLVQVFDELNERIGGILSIDQSVLDGMPPPSRNWTVASEPGMTLEILLHKKFLDAFPGLTMIFRNDQIIITTRDIAAPPQPQQVGKTNPPPHKIPAVERSP